MNAMKGLLSLAIAVVLFSSCDSQGENDPNTERFYGEVWQGKIVRKRDAISAAIPAAEEEFLTNVQFEKYGSMNFFGANLGDHTYQYWSYSWSIDQFYMNMSPVEAWYMSPDEDSLYLKYPFSSWDPATGVSFDWNYEFMLHH